MKLETVKIKHKDGFMLINKKDFDKDKHELFDVVRKDKKKKEIKKDIKKDIIDKD